MSDYQASIFHGRPIDRANVLRNSTVSALWELTWKYNTLNRRRWTQGVVRLLQQHQSHITELVLDHGYDAQTPQQQWSFPASLMFTLRYKLPKYHLTSN